MSVENLKDGDSMAVVAVTVKERFKDTVSISEDGLTFSNSKDSRLCKWENITNIFNWWDLDRLIVIDEMGSILRGNLPLHASFQSPQEQINYIWCRWADSIPSKDTITSFDYPLWPRKQENYLALENAVEGILCGLLAWGLFTGMMIREPIESRGDWALLVSLSVIGLLCFGWSFHNLKKRIRRKLEKVSVKGNIMEVAYDGGLVRSFNIPSIKDFKLNDPGNIGKIVLEDNTRLQNIERVSYWPVLREYLLSKLKDLKSEKG